MGAAISKGANGIGTLLGNAFVAPIKSVFAILLFFYLMFKVGICQCIVRSLCKMCWAACETYWFLFEDITCFLWHKLKNTNRVNRRRQHRRRFRDVDLGCSSDDENVSLEVDQGFNTRELHTKRKDRVESSFYPLRKNRSVNHSHHKRPHRVRMKTGEVYVHVKGNRSQRLKYSRQLQMRKLSSIQRELALFKKRRFRLS